MLFLCTCSTVRLLKQLFVAVNLKQVLTRNTHFIQNIVQKNGDCLDCLIRKEKYKEAPNSKFSMRVVTSYLTLSHLCPRYQSLIKKFKR